MPISTLFAQRSSPSGSFEERLSVLLDKPIVTFLYYCGVRLGEAKQIEWSQVDLKAALVRLEEDYTKNSEGTHHPATRSVGENVEGY
jgi:integrase